MSDDTATEAKGSRITYFGLFLSLFAMLLVRQTVAYFSPTLTFTAAIWKESLI